VVVVVVAGRRVVWRVQRPGCMASSWLRNWPLLVRLRRPSLAPLQLSLRMTPRQHPRLRVAQRMHCSAGKGRAPRLAARPLPGKR
jgi:hypothetical protein